MIRKFCTKINVQKVVTFFFLSFPIQLSLYMTSFWQNLHKPFFVLAPMEDVTDTVFRQIIMQLGKPDVFFTEFTNIDGLLSPKGVTHVIQRLQYTEIERPLVAQIWGTDPAKFYKAAQLLVEMKFDGIDINMGCPDKSVLKKGAGGGCIKDPTHAQEIIQATQEGAGNLPVSVKTRIGFKTIDTENWIWNLLEENLDALTVHGRTVAELSEVPAHWDEIGKVVALKNAMKKETLIIGNGDVKSLAEAKEKVTTYGVDGVMIATGIFQNPWLFNANLDPEKVTVQQRIAVLREHVQLFEQTWGTQKNFQILKKYFKIYISHFDGAQELRTKLMETNNGEEVQNIIDNYKI